MNAKQMGKIEVARSFIVNHPEDAANVFKQMQFIPVRAEAMFVNDSIEYTGISVMFDELPQGSMVPTYTIQIASNNKVTVYKEQ